MLDRWSYYTVTIIWEFASVDSALVILGKWSSYRDGGLNRLDCGNNKSSQSKKKYAGVGWTGKTNEKYENICKTIVLNLPKQTGSEEYAHSGDLFIRERIGSGSNLENQGSVQYWLKRTSKISPTPTQSFLKTCHHCPCFILKEGKITSLSWKNIKMCHLRHRLRIFLFHQKLIFHSYDIQVFLFLNI